MLPMPGTRGSCSSSPRHSIGFGGEWWDGDCCEASLFSAEEILEPVLAQVQPAAWHTERATPQGPATGGTPGPLSLTPGEQQAYAALALTLEQHFNWRLSEEAMKRMLESQRSRESSALSTFAADTCRKSRPSMPFTRH